MTGAKLLLDASTVKQEAAPEPFLKWAGGKTQLLGQLDRFFPGQFKTYYEPFVGSAAAFFHLRRTRTWFPAWLADSNAELVNCYQMVRDKAQTLIPLLKHHQREHGKHHYYDIRGQNPETLTKVQRAARLIYLNKTCYNGLHRVNAKGEFNVPMGSYSNPRIVDEETLKAASKALKDATLCVGDFSAVLDTASRNDLIYFDPPYYTEGNGFTSYSVSASGKNVFGAEEHRRLLEVVKELSERDCHVVISNSDTEYIRRLYKNFNIHVVHARRAINSNGNGRGTVTELIITNR